MKRALKLARTLESLVERSVLSQHKELRRRKNNYKEKLTLPMQRKK
jgi:hypothetical protein